MEGVAEGVWELADLHERHGEIAKSVKCLEAICQSTVSFLPVIEVKTRLRIATLLLKHSNNVNHAKSHLERSQLLLKAIPSCFELKCRAYSLLSQCYHLVGAVSSQKQLLNKGLELAATFGEGFSGKLWSCNFNSQLANALIIEGDYQGSVSALEQGYVYASDMYYPELQMFFATSVLHVHLMQWEDGSLVEGAVSRCNDVWESIDPDKSAGQHVDKLDAAMKTDLQKMQHARELTKELDIVNEGLSQTDLPYRDRATLSSRRTQLEGEISNSIGSNSVGQEVLEPAYFGNVKRELGDKLELAPPPIDGEWLPKSAVYSLVDLMMVVFGRPKGLFKECGKRIQSGLNTIKEIARLYKYELKLSSLPKVIKLLHSAGTDLDFLISQKFLGWSLANIEMLYLQQVELQHSAIWMAGVYLMILMQFLENKVAMELTRSEFVEAQEPVIIKLLSTLFEAQRVRLASGLQTTHTTLGNLQLVSQYLTVLGNLALALHDTVQAREILRSSLTLSKKLYDIPTQIWVISNLTALYEQVHEEENEMENREYEKKKTDELRKRLANVHASPHHRELIEKAKFQVQRLNEVDIKRAIAGPSMNVNLDIPESVGLSSSAPRPSSRLMDVNLGRRVTRRG
ncbi:sister chromatid cohesion protein SCC4 isoform X2 [Tanacetum coccineum]